MSQVRNLRAMFENKGDSSPPDRGRSPGISPSRRRTEADASSSSSPRPLSKVRTNFVAIERDGRIGLRRDESGESSLANRIISPETPDDGGSTTLHRKSHMVPPKETIKIPRQGTASNPPGADSLLPGVEELHCIEKIAQDSPAVTIASNCKRDISSFYEAAQETTSSPHMRGAEARNEPAKRGNGNNKPTMDAKGKGNPAKLDNTSTATSSAVPDAKGAAQRLLNKRASSHTLIAVAMGSSTLPKRDMAPSRTTGRHQTAVIGHSTSGNRFQKPKPKSPTKPVHLPSSLTAPTASSFSKTYNSNASKANHIGSRLTSSALYQTSQKAGAGSSSLSGDGKRPNSSTSSSRPSLGPPPSRILPAVISKRSPTVDEGFLARMMRPTQSSSSKLADKMSVTPPKKTAQRSGGSQHLGSSNRASTRLLGGRGSHVSKRQSDIKSADLDSPQIEKTHETIEPIWSVDDTAQNDGLTFSLEVARAPSTIENTTSTNCIPELPSYDIANIHICTTPIGDSLETAQLADHNKAHDHNDIVKKSFQPEFESEISHINSSTEILTTIISVTPPKISKTLRDTDDSPSITNNQCANSDDASGTAKADATSIETHLHDEPAITEDSILLNSDAGVGEATTLAADMTLDYVPDRDNGYKPIKSSQSTLSLRRAASEIHQKAVEERGHPQPDSAAIESKNVTESTSSTLYQEEPTSRLKTTTDGELQ